MQQAGTYVGKSGIAGRDSFPVDPVKWEAFRGWFVKGLKTLQLVRCPLPSTTLPDACVMLAGGALNCREAFMLGPEGLAGAVQGCEVGYLDFASAAGKQAGAV